MRKVAVLDDYQAVALEMADWGALPSDVSVDVFKDHLSDEDEVARRLEPYCAVVAMRERTPFRRSLIERLPNLKLLVTTGMRNASIDVGAAADNGVTVCGTNGLPYPTAELTWALILALARRVRRRRRGDAAGRVAGDGGRRSSGQDAGGDGAWQAGFAGCDHRQGVRDESLRVEPEPD